MGPRTSASKFRRGQRLVTKHVGSDIQMSLMAFRRSFAQAQRHLVELNHRSEVHFMTVIYDPRSDNPSLTLMGSRELVRASLRSTLKDEVCSEYPSKTLLKNTIRVPVFCPRDISELGPLVQKEKEEHSLTTYWYNEMQRCTFPMNFFKHKSNDSWIPRENLAFWPPDLKIHTAHEPGFGTKNDGSKLDSRTDTVLYLLHYLKDYYSNILLKSLHLKLVKMGEGFFKYVNSEDDDIDVDVEGFGALRSLTDKELCVRTLVHWILKERISEGNRETMEREEMGMRVPIKYDVDGSSDIDVCGTEECSTVPIISFDPLHDNSSVGATEEVQTATGNTIQHQSNDDQRPSTSSSSANLNPLRKIVWTNSPQTQLGEQKVKTINASNLETVQTVVVNGKRIVVKRLQRSQLQKHGLSDSAPQKMLPQTIRFIKAPASTVDMKTAQIKTSVGNSGKRVLLGMHSSPHRHPDVSSHSRSDYCIPSMERSLYTQNTNDIYHEGEVVTEETVVSHPEDSYIEEDTYWHHHQEMPS